MRIMPGNNDNIFKCKEKSVGFIVVIFRHLMKTACNIKIKKLQKYKKEHANIKEAERLAEDPLTRYYLEIIISALID